MNETEKCLLCRAVELYVEGVCQWLNEGVSIFLLVCYLVSEVVKNGLVELFG